MKCKLIAVKSNYNTVGYNVEGEIVDCTIQPFGLIITTEEDVILTSKITKVTVNTLNSVYELDVL